MIEAHFYEQDRRDAIAVQLREQMLDSSERFRILEELYDWFVMTKDFVVGYPRPTSSLVIFLSLI